MCEKEEFALGVFFIVNMIAPNTFEFAAERALYRETISTPLGRTQRGLRYTELTFPPRLRAE